MIHKTCNLDVLEAETRAGWRFVRIIEDEEVVYVTVNKAKFVPPTPNGGYQSNTGWIPHSSNDMVLRRRALALLEGPE